MNKRPWYKDGLRFECTQCGDCCSGAPGVVWVNEEEMENLAKLLELDLAAFKAKFTRKVGGRISLVEYPDGDCVFLDPEKRNCLFIRPVPFSAERGRFGIVTWKPPPLGKKPAKSAPVRGSDDFIAWRRFRFAQDKNRFDVINPAGCKR